MINKIIVVGPANSGKSVFVLELIEVLEDQNVDFGYVDLDLWGSTTLMLLGKETPQEREERKRNTKVTKFDIKKRAKEFQDHSNDIVLGDAPGMISDDLNVLSKPASMAIIVCRDEWDDELKEWIAYLKKRKIPIIGIVHSVFIIPITVSGFIVCKVLDINFFFLEVGLVNTLTDVLDRGYFTSILLHETPKSS